MFSSTNKAGEVGNKVCVVGAGALGLVACKNLMERGLSVTVFEQNEYVGGMWHVSQDPTQVSALTGTRFYSSKQTSSFTDFPIPDEYHTHPTAKELQVYLESFAEHFDLLRHIELSTLVTCVRRDVRDNLWLVSTRHIITGLEKIREFDRVITATGIFNAKNQPMVRGIEKFAGDIIHSLEFKDPSIYTGKNVLVVGTGPTGADTVSFLKEINVGRLYLSHRQPLCAFPRFIRGLPFDHYFSRRAMTAFRYAAHLSPTLASLLVTKVVKVVGKMAFPFLDYDRPLASPHQGSGVIPLHRTFFVSDELPCHLRDGEIELVREIHEVTGPNSVAFEDGSEITNIDAIIFCTGYYQDFSIIYGPGNPADPAFAVDKFRRLEESRFRKPSQQYPRLYRGILSERYPGSLAVLGHLLLLAPVSTFAYYDLATMALASLWSGNYPLPAKDDIREEIDAHYEFVLRTLDQGPMPFLGLRIDKGVYEWMNLVAGTGVIERLGSWGWEGWKYWWSDRGFYRTLMDGPIVPAVYRLFDTAAGRPPWDGARATIEKANWEVRMMREAWNEQITSGTRYEQDQV